MAVSVEGLREQVRTHAAELSRSASHQLERDLRDRVRKLEQWDYGTAKRARFDPHWVLHGAEVDGRTDPQLANPGPWPPNPFFYPQDHAGCRCSLRQSRRTVRRTQLRVTRWLLESKSPAVRALRLSGGRRLTLTRNGEPPWFTEVVNAQTWAEALRQAQGA